MAHKDWCGKPCAQCEEHCALDESIPCSPDCENLSLDGKPGRHSCTKCDVYITNYADKEGDS